MDYHPNDGVSSESPAEPILPDENLHNTEPLPETPSDSYTLTQPSEIPPASDIQPQTAETSPAPQPDNDATVAAPVEPSNSTYPNYNAQPQGYTYPNYNAQPQGYTYPNYNAQPQGYTYPNYNAQPQGYTYPNYNAQPQGYTYPNYNAQPQGYTYPNYNAQPYYPYPPYPVAPYQPNSKGKCFGRAMIAIAVFLGAQIVLGIFMGISIVFAQFDSYSYDIDYAEIAPVIAITLILSSIISIIALIPLYRRETKARQIRPKSYPPHYPSVTLEPFALTTKGKLGPGILFPMAGIIAIASNILVTGILTFVQSYFPPESSPVDEILNSIPEDSIWMALTLLTVGVIAPIAEELCLRGLCFNHLRRGFSFWSANLIQAALFGVIHGNLTQASYAFLLGFFFGWVYEKTKRLSLPILLHIVFNSTSVMLGFIPGINPLLGHNPSNWIAIILPSFVITAVGVTSMALILRQPKKLESLPE